MPSVYASQTPVAARRAQCERIAAKHGASMVPIVLEATGRHPKVDFTALPASATVADLQAAVREVSDVSKRGSLALTVDGCTPTSSTTVGDLHAACRSADGFLYVAYTGEATMGCGIALSGGGSGGDRTITPPTQTVPYPGSS